MEEAFVAAALRRAARLLSNDCKKILRNPSRESVSFGGADFAKGVEGAVDAVEDGFERVERDLYHSLKLLLGA